MKDSVYSILNSLILTLLSKCLIGVRDRSSLRMIRTTFDDRITIRILVEVFYAGRISIDDTTITRPHTGGLRVQRDGRSVGAGQSDLIIHGRLLLYHLNDQEGKDLRDHPYLR
jgi:hypothetical protein